MDFDGNICNLPEICNLTLHRLPDDKGYAINFIAFAEAATNTENRSGVWTSKVISPEELDKFYDILRAD